MVNTTFSVYLVLGLAVAGIILAGSGFDDNFASQPPDTELEEKAKARANESAVSTGFTAEARGEEDGSIMGFVIAGGGWLLDMITLIAVLPAYLMDHGAPFWFAFPVGMFFEIWASVGFIQWLTGRIYR